MDHDPARPCRRRVACLAAGAVLAAAAGLGPRLASAGRSWCRSDPTFSVGGLVANVYVAAAIDAKLDTRGPIKLVITTPRGVPGELLAADAGFGHGYDVRFEQSAKLKHDAKATEVAARVLVPATPVGKDRTILVEFVPGGSVEVAAAKTGPPDTWIEVKTKLGKK